MVQRSGARLRRPGRGATGPGWAALVLTVLLAGCGVSANDDQSVATPAPDPTTTTADPVLPGLDAGPVDRTTSTTTDREVPDHGPGRDDEPEDGDFDPETEADIARMVRDYRQRCDGGDERACDLLFLWSDEGTDDFDFGADCGGRSPGTSEYCTPGLELDDEHWASPTAPAIRALGEECRADDALACDLLYFVLDDDEDLAEVGRSCNGRFPDGPAVSCTLED